MAVTSMRPNTAAMTIAPRTALGSVLNRGARKIAVARIKPDVIKEEACDLTPAASPVAVWERLASVAKSSEQPSCQVGGPERHKLLVRVDLVAMASGENAAGADRFAHRDENNPGRADHKKRKRGQRDRSKRRKGHASRDLADHRDALLLEAE